MNRVSHPPQERGRGARLRPLLPRAAGWAGPERRADVALRLSRRGVPVPVRDVARSLGAQGKSQHSVSSSKSHSTLYLGTIKVRAGSSH